MGLKEVNTINDDKLEELDSSKDLELMMDFRGTYWSMWEKFCEESGYKAVVTK